MNQLKTRPARPRPRRTAPSYPRTLIAAGLALNVAGCMGAAPDAYQPAAPSSHVVVQDPPSDPSAGYAQPPPETVAQPPQPVEGVEDPPEVMLDGEAPVPFEG